MPTSVFSLANLTSALEAELTNDFIDERPFLDIMKRKGRVMKKAGDQFSIDFNTNPPDVKSYGAGSTFVASQKGENVRATFGWGALYLDDKEFGWDIENQGTPGKISEGAVRDLVTTRTSMMKDAFFLRANTRLWQSGGVAYNSGEGVGPLGVEDAVRTSPSTGTYGGLSAVTYSNLRSQQISGTAGPSTDWDSDCWERLLTLRVTCMYGKTWNNPIRPKLAFCNRSNYIEIINLAYTQNTNVGVTVDDLVSVGGIMPQINDAQDASTVYLLAPETWCLYYPTGRRQLIELDVRQNLEEQINPKDTVLLMTMKCQLVCEFLRPNGMITNAA